MNSRRHFLKQGAIGMAAVASIPWMRAADATPAAPSVPEKPDAASVRLYWISVAERIAAPVLTNLAARTLKKNMPVEQRKGAKRDNVTHLEAFGRLLSGIAPWLEQDKPAKWVKLAQESLDAATDPKSPDFLNFTKERQPLVDAAYVALAILRAPTVLWADLDPRVKANVVAALKSTRAIRPNESNWLLFAASVEAALHKAGEEIVRSRVDHALTKHMEWYMGDGMYGDGPEFHWDYYNGYVIQPMLFEVSAEFADDKEWGPLIPKITRRAQRYAAILERMVSPEGTFPMMGRSSAYRYAAFQPLALMALRDKLPHGVSPARVRCAMTAVIRRQTEAPGMFDADGWLQIGFCGHQPNLADYYVSTGSLYICSNALLTLGLPASHPFWSAPDEPWTQVKAWGGVDMPGDHAID